MLALTVHALAPTVSFFRWNFLGTYTQEKKLSDAHQVFLVVYMIAAPIFGAFSDRGYNRYNTLAILCINDRADGWLVHSKAPPHHDGYCLLVHRRVQRILFCEFSHLSHLSVSFPRFRSSMCHYSLSKSVCWHRRSVLHHPRALSTV